MSLSIGIVGLPNVGKSTLFNALTSGDILSANYPFATIEPNTGIVPVPDERLEVLAKMYATQKIIPATVQFVDIAGLVAGASKGEGLGNKFLANIRECSAIIHLVRAFENTDILHVNERIDPKADIEIINTELILADIESLETHIPKIQKLVKADPKMSKVVDYLTFLQNKLMAGVPISALPKVDIDPEKLDGLQLLTAKPVIYVFNVDEATLLDKEKRSKIIKASNVFPEFNSGIQSARHSELDSESSHNNNIIFINALLEEELRKMSVDEKKEFLAEYGIGKSGLEQLAQVSYKILGLQSFLTAGEKEVRAWTIHKGDTAPKAAGVIHTDFEHGFIAAQVVSYPDLIQAGSESAARSLGKIRTEGKTYLMHPDDIVEFRFNV